MKQYFFREVVYIDRGKAFEVVNEEQECVGFIGEADILDCEKEHTFSFTSNKGYKVSMGIKKRDIYNFLIARYVIEAGGKNYFLKDKTGSSLLYFCVVGEIEGEKLLVEENWSKDVEVKIHGRQIAAIKKENFSLKPIFLIDELLDESSLLFAIIFLMYFMYKIYNKETAFIEMLF